MFRLFTKVRRDNIVFSASLFDSEDILSILSSLTSVLFSQPFLSIADALVIQLTNHSAAVFAYVCVIV